MAATAEGFEIRAGFAGARGRAGERALQGAVIFWFLVTFVGQFLFALHIVSFYGRTAAVGDFAAWNKHLEVGVISGDTVGNGALGMHLAMAAVVTVCGLLQLIPLIRQRAPVFHRWMGRVYIVAAFAVSAAALYLQLVRGAVPGGLLQHTGLVLNAVLIMLFAATALNAARARRFASHRRWALRLFMASSGVWFFRVGLFFWLLVNRGPVGFDPNRFEGPFLTFLSFAQYLLPLAVLEVYLRVRERGGAFGKRAVAVTVVLLTLVMMVGIFGHARFMISRGVAI